MVGCSKTENIPNRKVMKVDKSVSSELNTIAQDVKANYLFNTVVIIATELVKDDDGNDSVRIIGVKQGSHYEAIGMCESYKDGLLDCDRVCE